MKIKIFEQDRSTLKTELFEKQVNDFCEHHDVINVIENGPDRLGLLIVTVVYRD